VRQGRRTGADRDGFTASAEIIARSGSCSQLYSGMR